MPAFVGRMPGRGALSECEQAWVVWAQFNEAAEATVLLGVFRGAFGKSAAEAFATAVRAAYERHQGLAVYQAPGLGGEQELEWDVDVQVVAVPCEPWVIA